ncbi:MAG: PhpK family radical SAM P-methyltransferase [Sulfuricella sp.]|nr:PhpK family radical SAM P-methyltransferase [Sulfuricella sp.]
MTDCLLIGFNDYDFGKTVTAIRGNDPSSGAYRDLNLAFITRDGKERRAMDILNEVNGSLATPYHNADFLWPVILYLGSYLARHGFSFDYVNLFHLEKDKLRAKLAAGDVRSVAITTTLYVSPQPIIEIVAFVRECNPDVKIIIGGPYIASQAAMLDDESLRQLFAYLEGDYYVIGAEGEAALVAVLQALREGGDFSGVRNVAYRDGADFVLNERALEENPLEDNPVDYTLFPTAEIGEFLSIRTAKSCPFACAFCGFSERAGKYRYLDLAHVEKELDAIRAIGTVTTVTFLDDTFNVPKKRFRDILRLMIDKRYGFRWNSFYRSDHGDAETIRLMAEAGCEGVFLGIESGSDVMLAAMNKTSRRKNYLEAIRHFRDNGIVTHANLLVGFPGETAETVAETVSLIEEARPDFFRAQLWYCDPITPIWQKREEFGIRDFAFNWRHNTMDFRTASQYVEQMFLTVRNAIWLPQQGFELWSVFYLQRKGFSLAQIKGFVRAFNDAIREKLLFPDAREPTPQLVENLQRWGKIQHEADLPAAGENAPLYNPQSTDAAQEEISRQRSEDESEEFQF